MIPRRDQQAEARARAEAASIEIQARVESAKLEAQARKIIYETEIEETKLKQDAEVRRHEPPRPKASDETEAGCRGPVATSLSCFGPRVCDAFVVHTCIV
jgi:hypothetical protein